MAIYEIKPDCIEQIAPTTFSASGLKERQDLQRLLRRQIEIISPNTLIVAEEFGEWEDSRRRIDLLGVDKDANLVVIELKRTEDGGRMELQAIRYAAMVSTMTFERVVEVFDRYLRSNHQVGGARELLLQFLEWDEPAEDEFAQDVRIVLASAEFSKELTTAVLWLNDRGLDVRCIRLKPYADNGRILLDVQQVIPLPEAEQYQVQLREKSQHKRASRRSNRDYTKYDVVIAGEVHARQPKRRAVYLAIQHLCSTGMTPDEIIAAAPWRQTNTFQSIEGEVSSSDEFVERCAANLSDQGKKFDARRFYTDMEDLIVCNGRTYCVSNQWGGRAIEWVGGLLNGLPDHGIKLLTCV